MTPEDVIRRIDSFQGFFEEKFLATSYMKAWNLNRRHGLYLNHLPKASAEYLERLVVKEMPKTILEIGTSVGYSTLHLARGAESYGGHVYTIEKSAPRAEFARVHFKQSGLQNITLLEGKAELIIPTLDLPIDLLFLDGGKKLYLDFLKELEPRLPQHAIIIADNVSDHEEEVKDFLDYIKKKPHYISEVVSIDNGLLIARLVPIEEKVDEGEDDREK